MALGMTYEQYWYGDPLMVRAFYKADKLRQKRMNEQAWLYGAYVYRALAATVGNMGKKKGEKPIEYPKEPIETEVSPEKTEKQEENEALIAKAWMTQFVQIGKNWGKK